MTDDRSVPAGQGDGPRDAEQEQVSRLLAAAAAAEPMPPDVASRLDATLAELVAEREGAAGPTAPPQTHQKDADPDPGGSVTPLTALRRRRWPGLLVAAATVSVLGLGVGNLLGQAGQGGAGDSAVTADSAGEALEEAPPSRSLVEDEDELGGQASELQRPLPRLRTVSLAADVRRLLTAAPADPPTTSSRDAAAWCVRPATSRTDELVRVRLDGRRAVLVLGPADEGRRTAEVFTCDDGDTPAATVTVDTP